MADRSSLRVLVGCEYSGIVRNAFLAEGFDAWSCDLLPAEDGSKRPLTEWAIYQRRLPTAGKLRAWYADAHLSGIGFVCGAISGGLECLEFDDPETYQRFRDTAALAG